MKRYLALTLLALVGCASIPSGTGLRFIVQNIALVGTAETIKHAPATKPKFVLTLRSLDALVLAGSNDPVALQNALTNLPIGNFDTPSGQILLAEGAMLISFIGHDVIQIDTRTNANKYVKPVANGFRDGIRQGIALSP